MCLLVKNSEILKHLWDKIPLITYWAFLNLRFRASPTLEAIAVEQMPTEELHQHVTDIIFFQAKGAVSLTVYRKKVIKRVLCNHPLI